MNGTQERMRYIRQLQQYIVERVFIDKRVALAKALHVIAEENQKLLNCNSPTFMYDGEWWPYEKVPHPDCNKELHPSLREKVSLLLDNLDFNERDIRAGIESLIGNALATARDGYDLIRLLPQQLNQHRPCIDSSVFNIGNPLTEEEVTAFQEANKENTKFLKKMLITNLLLAKH